jgi:hypothetical protein
MCITLIALQLAWCSSEHWKQFVLALQYLVLQSSALWF